MIKGIRFMAAAGDYWGAIMDQLISNDVQMSPADGDAALYVKKKNLEKRIQ